MKNIDEVVKELKTLPPTDKIRIELPSVPKIGYNISVQEFKEMLVLYRIERRIRASFDIKTLTKEYPDEKK